MSKTIEFIRSKIWDEVAEPDNPFAAAACYCSGYDVYGDLLGKASWAEFMILLLRCERPSATQARLLEDLAVVLGNPGPRDPGVGAAMTGGAGGSAAAACLMAALAAGAGQLGGGRDVFLAMGLWRSLGRSLAAWTDWTARPPVVAREESWQAMEHAPGFDPHGTNCSLPVQQALRHLAAISPGETLAWLAQERAALESAVGYPLAMSGVAAAALVDLGLSPEQGEMLYLLLRLPGAAAHALEQRIHGWSRFPVFGHAVKLADDPGPRNTKVGGK